jgi:hypothetical protein
MTENDMKSIDLLDHARSATATIVKVCERSGTDLKTVTAIYNRLFTACLPKDDSDVPLAELLQAVSLCASVIYNGAIDELMKQQDVKAA